MTRRATVLHRRSMAIALPSLMILAGASASQARAESSALRTSMFISDDADDTSVLRTGMGALFRYRDARHYQGLVLEDVRIQATGGVRHDDRRLYYAFAAGDDIWAWKGQLGTDGDTLLGQAALVREGIVRHEYFVERDLLETAQGVQAVYSTFVGAAYDLPLGVSDRYQLTLLGGAQDFGGENLRSHVRARYVAVVNPAYGLSVQLRGRAFHNSEPFELDYYSPRWFVEALPTVQLRRFRQRWMYTASLGWGAQRDSGSDWRTARTAEVSVTSPRVAYRGYLRASALYSNTPVAAGSSYGYRQFALEWIHPL